MDTVSITLNKYIDKIFFEKSKLNWKITKNNRNEYIRYVNYNNCKIQYNCAYNCLKLTFSCTKLIYGANYYTFKTSDIPKLYSELDSIVRIAIKTPIIAVSYWYVTRLDLASNFIFSNLNDKKIYLDLLKKVNFPFCKTTYYSTSLHSKNKSRCYNFYDKNEECSSTPKNLLRLEIQMKNSTIYRLVKNNTFSDKTFGTIMKSTSILNNLFKKNLQRLGLDKDFICASKMNATLIDLYKKNIIGKTKFNNMYNYFVNNSVISKNTLIDYKCILATMNYSNHTLSSATKNKIDFMNFSLFIEDNKKIFSKALSRSKIIIIYLFSILSEEVSKITNTLKLFFETRIILKLIFGINDS